MRGHVRQRGSTWYYLVDLGNQQMQRCDCGFRAWVERKPLDSCPKCGRDLISRIERRQTQKGGYPTRREAQTALTTVLARMQQGSYVEPARVTLRDYLTDEWLPAVKAKVKPSTYLSYETHVHRHINPAIGSVPLQKLTPTILDAFYGTLSTEPRKPVHQPRRKNDAEEGPAAKPLSPLTCRKVHATLHKALADAVRKDRLLRNPADAADPPKTKSARTHDMKTWTAKELRAFLESAEGTRLYPLWLILATTGMRRGEALGLGWDDVDMENARLSIRQNMVSVGYKVQIGRPKTGHGRNISLDPATLAVLKSLRRQQLEEKMQWQQAGYIDSGYVFRRENGTPYHPDLISQAFDKAVRDSMQPRIRLHDLRHTHATLALQAGVHPKVVSERLGHASISITLDIYSHAIPAMEEEAAARVAALFLG
jgi:integrase